MGGCEFIQYYNNVEAAGREAATGRGDQHHLQVRLPEKHQSAPQDLRPDPRPHEGQRAGTRLRGAPTGSPQGGQHERSGGGRPAVGHRSTRREVPAEGGQVAGHCRQLQRVRREEGHGQLQRGGRRAVRRRQRQVITALVAPLLIVLLPNHKDAINASKRPLPQPLSPQNNSFLILYSKASSTALPTEVSFFEMPSSKQGTPTALQQKVIPQSFSHHSQSDRFSLNVRSVCHLRRLIFSTNQKGPLLIATAHPRKKKTVRERRSECGQHYLVEAKGRLVNILQAVKIKVKGFEKGRGWDKRGRTGKLVPGFRRCVVALVFALISFSLWKLQYNRQIVTQKMLQNLHNCGKVRTSGVQPAYSGVGETCKNQKSYNKKWEEGEQASKKLQLTTTDLFLWKAQRSNEEIETTFQLIRLAEGHTPAGQVTLEHLQTLSFPVLKYQVRELVDFGVLMLRTTQFCCLNFTERVTKRLVSLLARNYNAVAYHNFSHAFYFTMLVYQCFSREFALRHACTDEEYFYVLVAGLCHDINHNGSTNAFEIKVQSQLALEVKNESVLENMHIRHLWRILEENPDLNFILPAKNKPRAREIVTRLILSTDMAYHSKNLEKFKQLRRNSDFDLRRNSEHKWATVEQVFHACDIGNPCTDYNNYIAWGALLSHEFSEVFRQEKRLHLEVTKCLEMTSVESVYKDQVWFINCLVQPIWRELGDLFPSLAPMTTNIDANLKRVKEELDKLKG